MSFVIKFSKNIIWNFLSLFWTPKLSKKNIEQIENLENIKKYYLKNKSTLIFVLDKYKWILNKETCLPDILNAPFNNDLIEFLYLVNPENLVFISKKNMWRLSHSKDPEIIPEIFASTRYIPQNTKDFFEENPHNKLIVVLDGVNDPRNIGSIIRILEGLGNTSAVIFTENTIFNQRHIIPGERFTLSRQYGRTSCGTYKVLPTFQDNINNIHKLAKLYKYKIVVVDNISGSKFIKLNELKLNNKTILVFGSENSGVSKQMLSIRNELVEIPMDGIIQSLNVQTAITIVLWHLRNLN